MKVKSMDDLLLLELKDLYSAEKQLLKALPKMAAKATNPQLKKALEKHLTETEGQVGRLDQIAGLLEVKLTGHACKAMEGLIAEGDELLKEIEPGDLLDAAMIGACNRVEHYEIASYGTARAFAQQLNHSQVVKLLQANLDEEGAADKTLTKIAESRVNEAALN